MDSLKQHAVFIMVLALAGLLCEAVVSQDALEKDKPNMGILKEGDAVTVDWEAQPDVYYFVEGSQDLSNWTSAKLLKDTEAEGDLEVGAAASSNSGFYRLSLEGDPDSARLREDSDGDKIINLLEVEAGWDAFEVAESTDSDDDGIPDYWETFHFDSLEHDGDYVATTGGLLLAQAYANATDPKKTDSDGDGWTDVQELTWGWNPNYNQSRDDSKYGPNGDFDGDGANNASEFANGTDLREKQDTPPPPSRYAVIDLGLTSTINRPSHVSDQGTVLLSKMERCINSNYKWSFENGVEALTPTRSVASDMNRHGLIVGGVENNAYDTQSSAGDETLAAYWPPDQENAVQLANNGSGNLTSGNSLIDAVDASGNIMGVKNTLLATTNSSWHFMVSWSGSIANGFETMLGTPNAIEVTRTYPENSNPDPFYYKTMLEGRVFETVGLNQTKGWIGKEKEHFVDPTNININSEGPINFTGFKPSESRYMFETTELDFRPIAINDNGVILGKQSGAYGYSVGDEGFTECVSVSGAVIGLSSPAETSEPLRIITLKGLYQQKAVDPSVEELSYASVTATTKFDYWTTSELVNGRNANATNWTNITGYAISANGDFIAATAINTDGEERSLLLLKVDIAVDNNRDGEVSFNGTDTTSEDEPHTFWVNDDNDGTGDGTENVSSSTKDYANGQLSSKRDLEDLSRIHLEISSIEDVIVSGDLKLGLKWKNAQGTPAIRLYRNADILGGTGYITDDGTAGLQTSIAHRSAIPDESNVSTVSPGSIYIFKKSFLQSMAGSEIKPLLFEGSGEGSGELAMVLLDKNDQEIGEGSSVWLNLENIKNMYVRGRADWPGQDPPRTFYGPTNNPPEPSFGFVFDQMGYPFDQPWYETGETIFFVHGWNQPYENSISFAETTFKRIWHRGFTGRFAMFRWPTEVGLTTYNDSDYKAWKSGSALKSFVQSVPGQTKSIAAHSMGNIVTGSALEKGMSVTNYALLNAAVPAACYDTDASLHVNSYVTPIPSSEFGFGGFLGGVSGNLVNFYLPQDFALVTWDVNNDINKPHILPAFAGSYSYDPNVTNPLERLSVSFLLHADRLVQTNHEAMSYVIQSQTWAAGSDGRTRGSINSDVDLSQYGFGDEHSAEWNRTPQQTADFYEELLIQFQIFPNP